MSQRKYELRKQVFVQRQPNFSIMNCQMVIPKVSSLNILICLLIWIGLDWESEILPLFFLIKSKEKWERGEIMKIKEFFSSSYCFGSLLIVFRWLNIIQNGQPRLHLYKEYNIIWGKFVSIFRSTDHSTSSCVLFFKFAPLASPFCFLSFSEMS